ncbi:MAG: SseB family protein [Eubacterium sp.]|nr:SseB family protein [Candidatus Colimonas fimequi]
MSEKTMNNAPEPIRNDSLSAAMKAVRENPGTESTVVMLNEIVNARLLIPITLDREPEIDKETGNAILEKDTQIDFELIRNKEGQIFYPVFTDGEEMRKCATDKDQKSLIATFDDLVALLAQDGNKVSGFVVNPMGDNLVFPIPLIEAMISDMMKHRHGEDAVDNIEDDKETEE